MPLDINKIIMESIEVPDPIDTASEDTDTDTDNTPESVMDPDNVGDIGDDSINYIIECASSIALSTGMGAIILLNRLRGLNEGLSDIADSVSDGLSAAGKIAKKALQKGAELGAEASDKVSGLPTVTKLGLGAASGVAGKAVYDKVKNNQNQSE